MVARTVAERRLPRDVAAVQVDAGDAAVRRLQERQAAWPGGRDAVQDVRPEAARLVRLDQGHPRGPGHRLHEEHPGLGIGRGPRVVRAAARAGDRQDRLLAAGAALDQGHEHRPEDEFLRDLERFGPELRREVDQVVLGHPLAVEGRRPGGERLRLRQLLARHGGAPFDRAFLDRPHLFAGGAVEDVGEGGLRDLGNGLDQPAADDDVDQVRGGRDVVVPDAVMDGLEVPDPFAGRGVDADETFGVDVVAVPQPSVVVAGGRAGGQVDIAEFLVGGHRRPHVRVADRLPGVVLPGVDVLLALLGDGVEPPLELPRADIVAAHMPRRVVVLEREVEDAGADDDGVADHDHGLAVADVPQRDVLAPQVPGELDHAVLAEGAVGLAGGRVERHELLADRGEEQAFLLAVGPVLEAAGVVVVLGWLAALVALRIVDPQLLAGAGVERRDLAQLGRDVEPAIDDERGGPEHLPVVGRVLLDAGVGGRPPPRRFEPAEVRGVDLVERRVAGEAVVAAVVTPLAAAGALLGVDASAEKKGLERREAPTKLVGHDR